MADGADLKIAINHPRGDERHWNGRIDLTKHCSAKVSLTIAPKGFEIDRFKKIEYFSKSKFYLL